MTVHKRARVAVAAAAAIEGASIHPQGSHLAV
jgi:hypothetical protein